MDSIYNSFLRIGSVCLVLYNILFGLNNELGVLGGVFTLISNLYLLYKLKNNIFLFIIVFIIFYCNYSIVYANFFTNIDTMYVQEITREVSKISINILSVFNALLYLFFPLRQCKKTNFGQGDNFFVKGENQNTLVVIILAVILVVVFFIGYQAPDVAGERGTPKPIYEYSISFMIVGLYFSGNNKLLRNLILILVVAYSIQNFIYGGRIYGLQFLLCAYLCLYTGKIGLKKLSLVAMPFFLFFIIIGVMRGSLMSGHFDMETIMTDFKQNGMALDTAYSAYYTSEAFVYTSTQVSNRLVYMWYFVVSIFLGESVFLDGTLPFLSFKYVDHSFGGILPFYFWFFLGEIGIFVAVEIVRRYLKMISIVGFESNGWVKCTCVFLVCHTFRWYLYSPLGLFRGVLFLSIVYFFCLILQKMHKKKRLQKRKVFH